LVIWKQRKQVKDNISLTITHIKYGTIISVLPERLTHQLL